MYRDEDQRLTPDEIIPRDEMLLDVCLEEVLTEQTPPDLRVQILSQLDGVSLPVAEPPRVEAPVPPPIQTPVAQPLNGRTMADRNVADRNVSVRPARAHGHLRSQSNRQFAGLAIAASILLVGFGVSAVAWRVADNYVASNSTEIDSQPTTTPDNPSPIKATNQPVDEEHTGLAVRRFSEPLFGAKFPPLPEEQAVPWPLPYSVQRKGDAEVVQFVNARLPGRTTDAQSLDDDAWCRQVFEQIIGRAPSSEELVDFSTSPARDKRSQLVNQLLTGESYKAEYAAHWAQVWTEELSGPHIGESREALAHRDELQDYFAQAFQEGKTYDEIATDLIAANNSPAGDQANPAASLLLATNNDKAAVTAKVSEVLLGHSGRCAQCHDAPKDSIAGSGMSQQQFWQLAAFFQQAKPFRDEETGRISLINSDFVGLSGDISEAELYFDTLDKQRKIAYPVFIDGTPINPDGRVEVVDRRAELARLVVASEDFARAAVDLYWKKMIGSTSPQVWRRADKHQLTQGLAEQFAVHDFDQQKLLRWIALSDANRVEIDRPRAPIYDNALIALNDVRRQGRPITPDDSVMFARIASDSGDAASGSIFVPTADGLSTQSEDRLIRSLQQSDMTFADKVRHVFLHGVARQPSSKEQAAARQMLSAHNGNAVTAIDDIWWAITQSAEYQTARQ